MAWGCPLARASVSATPQPPPDPSVEPRVGSDAVVTPLAESATDDVPALVPDLGNGFSSRGDFMVSWSYGLMVSWFSTRRRAAYGCLDVDTPSSGAPRVP